LSVALALAAAHGQLPFAGGDRPVVDVERDEFAGAGGGAFGGAQQPAGLVDVQRPGAAWGSCSRRVLAGVGGAEPDEAVEVVDLAAMVRLDPPVVVEGLVDGEWWPGGASAYRGARVSVSWSKGPGLRHLTWGPADHPLHGLIDSPLSTNATQADKQNVCVRLLPLPGAAAQCRGVPPHRRSDRVMEPITQRGAAGRR